MTRKITITAKNDHSTIKVEVKIKNDYVTARDSRDAVLRMENRAVELIRDSGFNHSDITIKKKSK